MTIRRSILAALLLGLLLMGGSRAAPEAAPAKAKVSAELLKSRRDAARKTFELMWANNREGLPPYTEPVYRWSRRWLESERELSERKADQLAAYQAHASRMKELEKLTRDRFRLRVVPVEEASAAEYYALEAQIWVAREKDR